MNIHTNSYPKLIAELRRLLVRLTDHQAELPQAGSLYCQLQDHAQELKAAKDRQQLHLAAYRQATREVRQWMAAGRGVASRLRYYVKAEWGSSDSRLLELGIPVRKRGWRGSDGTPPEQAPPKTNGSERPA
jgi:hypothetical protein